MYSKIGGHKDETLYFLIDFKVSSTNNAAESSQRGVKFKKVEKFRSIEDASNYLDIKSFILTCKKQKLDILKSINGVYEKN